ncbi:MAG: succinylglutamate desuccinylase/aspartoacylase family protein, partial [bacterium]
IVVPMMNHPAFCAGTRSAPADGDRGNMNRVFPGRADGTPTEKMADYFTRHLLPLAQFVLDVHSGGKTLRFVPFASAYALDDAAQQARHEAAAAAFAAPYSVMRWDLSGATGMYDEVAVAQGKVFVTTELGGGGTTSADTCEIARRGIDNFLIHAGILRRAPTPRRSVRLEMRADGFVVAPRAGLLELLADPGDPVRAGQDLARIYAVERSAEPPTVLDAPIGGILLGRHHFGLVRPGDMVAAIARETD